MSPQMAAHLRMLEDARPRERIHTHERRYVEHRVGKPHGPIAQALIDDAVALRAQGKSGFQIQRALNIGQITYARILKAINAPRSTAPEILERREVIRRLIAGGMTQRAVANRLHLSRTTVQQHLRALRDDL